MNIKRWSVRPERDRVFIVINGARFDLAAKNLRFLIEDLQKAEAVYQQFEQRLSALRTLVQAE